MSVNIYQTGVSGLLAAQQQLATTGHNIANVNTEGYSRQRTEQNTTLSQGFGNNFSGTGTYIENITRIFSQFSFREQLVTQTQAAYGEKFSRQMDQLDSTMSTFGEKISTSINEFYRAMHGVADKPNDLTQRNMVLNQAKALTSDVRLLKDGLDSILKSSNQEMAQTADRVTAISFEIAKINAQILDSKGGQVSGKPNDLLDQRDRLVSELNNYTKATTIESPNGVMTVMIGDGKTLVAGITALSMSVIAGDPEPEKTQLQLNGKNSTFSLKGATLGGELGALIEYRDGMLTKTGAEIDLLSMGIASVLNQSQSEGLDLNALQGADIFSDLNQFSAIQARSLAHSDNAGTLVGAVTITDISVLTADEYEIEFDGTDYQMKNLTSGVITPMSPLGFGGGPYSIPGTGFEFSELSGVPVAGDKLLIKPTRNGSANFKVTLTDPQAIAASSAIGVTPSENNISEGTVTISKVYDPQAARTFVDVTYPSVIVDVYEDSGTPGVFNYRVYDSANPPPAPTIAAGSYLSGGTATIDIGPGVPGAFQIEITGKLSGAGADAREQFTLADAFGTGNGNNMLDMADTQNEPTMGQSKLSFAQVLSSTVSGVGAVAFSAESQAVTALTMAEQAMSRHQSLSGVNLDEEAANMLQYQKAYQASAKIIDVANTIFDTILASIR